MAKQIVLFKCLALQEQNLSYELRYKRIKHIILRVTPQGEVKVSSPYTVRESEIDSFVRQKSEWIFTQREKAMSTLSKPKEYVTGETITLLGCKIPIRVEFGGRNEVWKDNDCIKIVTKHREKADKRREQVLKWMSVFAKEYFTESLLRNYPPIGAMGYTAPGLYVKKMRTRWGSCLPGKNKIHLSLFLIKAPPHLIDYVVLHELCHLRHPNHSQDFYRLLGSLMPDWRNRKKELSRYGAHNE